VLTITFLGTGTSQGVPLIACKCEVCLSSDALDKRLRSSVLIQSKKTSLVIDTGPDFRQQMLREKIEVLDAVVFTHEHKDHIAGLDDVRGFNYALKRPMEIFCNNRVLEALKREFYYIFSEDKYPGIPQIDINLINQSAFFVGDIQVLPIQCMHARLPVLGYRFNRFAYITDTNYIHINEKEKLKNLDVLVVNALRKESHISHFTLQEAIDLVNELKPKQAYFTHISHQLGLHEKVQKELPANCFLAYDGLKLQVSN